MATNYHLETNVCPMNPPIGTLHLGLVLTWRVWSGTRWIECVTLVGAMLLRDELMGRQPNPGWQLMALRGY